jgi:hypothetical protein
MQVLELRNSVVLERLPVKFATKLEQEVFDSFSSVLITAEAI